MFNVAELREIIEMVEKSSLQSFELVQENESLRLVKASCGTMENSAAVAVPVKAEQSAASLPVTGKIQDAELAYIEIPSPMVGTFYLAAEPGGKPLVSVGQQVEPETVVGIVEVMKLFHEAEAGMAGTITEILVQDGDFVEYGQPLFRLRPQKG